MRNLLDDEIDFDNCNLIEVIKFLQKLAKSPDASKLNIAFTKHITDDLIKAREEKMKLETSIPRKLEDGWEPTIKMKINDFDCNVMGGYFIGRPTDPESRPAKTKKAKAESRIKSYGLG